jgi:hypothetical protein
VPAHCRMREFDRDLIREGHYGQRPSAPHQQAGHMSAPNQCCIHVKKLLSIRRRAHMTLSEPYSANKDDRDPAERTIGQRVGGPSRQGGGKNLVRPELSYVSACGAIRQGLARFTPCQGLPNLERGERGLSSKANTPCLCSLATFTCSGKDPQLRRASPGAPFCAGFIYFR